MMMMTTKKRKDVDGEFTDDFSDFSLSSPAFKSRRLDVEQFPPIVKEEEGAAVASEVKEEEIEEVVSGNEERAVVLYKPLCFHYSPSSYNLSVDSDIFSSFKNQFPWSSRSSYTDRLEEVVAADDISAACTAVVPWVPSPALVGQAAVSSTIDASETMETDVVGEASMEIEDESNNNENSNTNGSYTFGGHGIMGGGVGTCHPWHQQHCMVMPQLPQSNPTPVSWLQ